jgi:hypothetical protein
VTALEVSQAVLECSNGLWQTVDSIVSHLVIKHICHTQKKEGLLIFSSSLREENTVRTLPLPLCAPSGTMITCTPGRKMIWLWFMSARGKKGRMIAKFGVYETVAAQSKICLMARRRPGP